MIYPGTNKNLSVWRKYSNFYSFTDLDYILEDCLDNAICYITQSAATGKYQFYYPDNIVEFERLEEAKQHGITYLESIGYRYDSPLTNMK